MLPGNVILRDIEGDVEFSAIDPVVSMQAIVMVAAAQVCDLLAKAVEAI
jgi:hypothetical protein